MEGERGLIEREGVLGPIGMSSLSFIASFSLHIPVVMSPYSACLHCPHCRALVPVLVVVWSSCIVIVHFSMWLSWCLVSVSWEG